MAWELQEWGQKLLKDKVGPYAIDIEEWHSNLQGLVDFLRFLSDELDFPACLFISGDVHYGMNLKPPKTVRAHGIKRFLVLRPANTDAWSEDAPVFLSPREAKRLGIQQAPDYREQREYVPANGPHMLKIIGNNNIGLLSISGDDVIHRLLCPTEDELRIYIAAMSMGSA